MWGRIRSRWQIPVIAVITVAAAGLLYWGTRSTFVAGFGGFAVSLVAFALTFLGWVLRKGPGPAGQVATGQGLDHIADVLATTVKKQWEREAGERGLLEPEPIPVTWGSSPLPLAGPAAAAAGSRRFDPLPGLARVSEARLAAGKITDDLHAVYGGLGSGRLVIAGPWGAGKSGAGILLALAALKYREKLLRKYRKQVPAQERPNVPVPVLFTGQGWDPRKQEIRDWLSGRIQETYALGENGKKKAGALIDEGKIALILDGLDEIAEELRPVALQALNEQASFRLVLLTRADEMASAAALSMLQGAAAIELRPIDAATAAGYLESVQRDQPPDGWRDLIVRIRASPEGPLATALNSPLTLTLVRDTYQAGDNARELLDFSDHIPPDKAAEQITGHLLDRVLPAAYAPRPGQRPPRYNLRTAENALAKIAAQMNQDGTRDLRWWRFPAWAPTRPRAIFSGLAAGLAVGLVVGLVFGRRGGLLFGLGAGLGAGLPLGLGIGAVGGFTGGTPRRIGKLRMDELFDLELMGHVGSGMVFGGLVGLVVGLVFGLGVGLAGGVGVGVAGGGVGGIWAGLAVSFAVAAEAGLVYPEDTSTPSPAMSWRNDRSCALQLGVAGGLVVGLVSVAVLGIMVWLGGGGVSNGLRLALAFGPAAGLAAGLAGGLVTGLGNSQVWSSSLAALQLAMRWHTPVRLMRFLDDAHGRNILRTVGPVYQFRHARLQDRLARINDDRGNDSNTASGLAHTNNLPGNES